MSDDPFWQELVDNQERNRREANRFIMRKFNDLFLEGDFLAADSILGEAVSGAEKLPVNILLAFLSISVAAKKHLSNYAPLYHKTEQLQKQNNWESGILIGLAP